MRALVSAAVAGLILLAVFLVLIWAGQRRAMYFPFGAIPSASDAGLEAAEQVTFPTEDGLTLHAWFVPASRSPAWFTAIVFNGNAGNRAYRAPLAQALRQHNIAVLLFDYRGFGGNEGRPTEGGLTSDARAARAYVTARNADPKGSRHPSRIIYFGESIGTAVAARLAAEHPPAALILRSPFASMAEVGQFHYPFLPVRWLLRDRFATMDLIGRVASPLLVIAGDRDTIIPIAQSRRLFDAAASPKQLVVIRGADHNDMALLAGPEMIDAIVAFLKTMEPRFGKADH